MDYSKIELLEGEAAIHFKAFDPENPPPPGHYLVYCADEKINFDWISKYGCWGGSVMFGCDYEVRAYAKITQIYHGSNQS